MARLMSFSKTTEQILDRTKTVTRRTGWKFLKPGDRLWACAKTMGLKKGEKVQRLRLIEVVTVRRERLDALLETCPACDDDGPYEYRYRVEACRECQGGILNSAYDDVEREGFPGMDPFDFVDFFCREMRCTPDTEITRIEFRYVDEEMIDGTC